MGATEMTFGGRYAVAERVGVGGMAEVYRARDELLGREVAVKVLSERLSRDRSFVERFRREAQAAANLNHPNIVSLYDYGADDETYFIVMEYIDGRPLGDVISQDGPLLPERAAEIAIDVAGALERAHSAGLVHRDVKPNNIMITNTGQTKVTDFGIVRALGGDAEQTMTQTGMVIGTASYLSPEQAQGHPVDARSDVYSLGCVLHEMLTGNPPFSGETPLSIAYKHVREHAEPPSASNPDVPAPLDAIVAKALAKDPDDRYADAGAFKEDLQRFVAGQNVTAALAGAGATQMAPPVSSTQVMQEAEEYEEEEPSGRRAGWYVVGALAILGLFALLAWFIATNLLAEPEPVVVPRLVGLTQEEAEAELEELGLEAEVEERFSRQDEGEVIDQSPQPNRRIDEGETVTIVVSKGLRQVKVPDVEGRPLEEAQALLEDANLEVEIQRRVNEEVEEGHVIDQDPDAGDRVDVRSTVTLTVSSGPDTVTVPNVVNQSEDDAVAEIQALGLTAEIQEAPSDEIDEGFVIDQDPDFGAEAEVGDVVVIVVSTGPEARPMPDVTGEDADSAQAFLESDYGLEVSQVEEACGGGIAPGEVCRTDPPPDTLVESGDSAVLYVQPGDVSIPGGMLLAITALSFLF